MSVQTPLAKTSRFTGTHFAICMGAFFGVIIAVNVGMATLASTSWTGLVVRNSYVASQQFNASLAAAKVQKAAGWRSSITYHREKIIVRLQDRTGARLRLADPKLSVGRPVFEQRDKTVDLVTGTDGSASANLRLAPGEWALRIEGVVDGKPYRRDARLLVDTSYSGTLQ